MFPSTSTKKRCSVLSTGTGTVSHVRKSGRVGTIVDALAGWLRLPADVHRWQLERGGLYHVSWGQLMCQQ